MRGKLGLKPQKRANLLVTKNNLDTLIAEGNRVFSEDKYPKNNSERLAAQEEWRVRHEEQWKRMQQNKDDAKKTVKRIMGMLR